MIQTRQPKSEGRASGDHVPNGVVRHGEIHLSTPFLVPIARHTTGAAPRNLQS